MKKIFLFYSLLFYLSLMLCTLSLTAKDPEIIPSVAPQYLFEDSLLSFEVKDIESNHLRWEFGDGTILTGGKRADHVFKMRGNYTIRVSDLEGKTKDPVILQIRIVKDDREIVLTGEQFFVGIPVSMKAKGFTEIAVLWDFGDGTIQNQSRNVSHTYNRSGTFTVKAIDLNGKDGKEISKEIKIDNDQRSIRAASEIIAGEPAEITLENTRGGTYTWEFSDGQRGQGLSITNAVFKQPGIIKVTVTDQSGNYPPLTGQITVSADNRSLKSENSFALPDESLRIVAENFKGPGITWDFGDGTAINGTKTVTHKYKDTGSYTITARDFNGNSPKTFTTNITVKELSPDFQLSLLEIAFENGKAYRIAPLKNLPPAYIIKMKAMGRGILRGKWLLDGQAIGLFQVFLHQNKIAELKGAQVASLPMKDPGIHDLTLEFSNYTFQQPVPVIRYFITEADAIRIVSPEPGSKVTADPAKPLVLKWDCPDPLLKNKTGVTYQIVVSETPLQFLDDERTAWQDVGEAMQFRPDTSGFRDKDQLWVYWQVRALKPNGHVITISDISSFKLTK